MTFVVALIVTILAVPVAVASFLSAKKQLGQPSWQERGLDRLRPLDNGRKPR